MHKLSLSCIGNTSKCCLFRSLPSSLCFTYALLADCVIFLNQANSKEYVMQIFHVFLSTTLVSSHGRCSNWSTLTTLAPLFWMWLLQPFSTVCLTSTLKRVFTQHWLSSIYICCELIHLQLCYFPQMTEILSFLHTKHVTNIAHSCKVHEVMVKLLYIPLCCNLMLPHSSSIKVRCSNVGDQWNLISKTLGLQGTHCQSLY